MLLVPSEFACMGREKSLASIMFQKFGTTKVTKGTYEHSPVANPEYNSNKTSFKLRETANSDRWLAVYKHERSICDHLLGPI